VNAEKRVKGITGFGGKNFVQASFLMEHSQKPGDVLVEVGASEENAKTSTPSEACFSRTFPSKKNNRRRLNWAQLLELRKTGKKGFENH